MEVCLMSAVKRSSRTFRSSRKPAKRDKPAKGHNKKSRPKTGDWSNH
jgi:hypothetical protein